VSAGTPADRDQLLPPPPDPLPTDPKTAHWGAGTELLRIYSPLPYGYTELSFRWWGPALRFDHHRSPITAPSDDPERSVWYGAPLAQPISRGSVRALELCMWECFGRERRVDLSCSLGRVKVKAGETLDLLSLVDADAADAGTIAQLAATPTPGMSQAWSRFFYDRPDVYGDIDGLLYRSTWLGGLNVLLYERAGGKIEPYAALGSLPLTHPALQTEVASIADARRWTLASAVLP